MSSQMETITPEIKVILEPVTSTTSLHFIRDDYDEERDQPLSSVQDPFMEKVACQVLTYKLVRASQMLAVADPIATVAQLNVLYDMDLQGNLVQNTLMEHGAIDVIVNLLEVQDTRCIIGALNVIEKISSNNTMRLYITNLGAISNLIELLKRTNVDILMHVAKCVTQLSYLQKPARYFRKLGGVPFLIDHLYTEESTLNTPMELLTEKQKKQIRLVTSVAETLKQITNYPKTVQYLYKHGLLLVLKKLITSCHKDLLIQIFELLVHCGKNPHLRQTIENEGIIMALVEYLNDDDERVRTACAMTIAECATESPLTCHLVRILNALPTVVELSKDFKQDNSTLAALTFATAKLAQETKNLKVMTDRGYVSNLIRFMKTGLMNEEIVANVLEGLAECGRLDENRSLMANSGIIPIITSKLMVKNPRILTAAAMVLGTLARSPDVAEIIMKFDGTRLLFSILQDENESVPATAMWALRPLIKNTKESAEEIRSIMGGFTVLTSLLSSRNWNIIAQACGLVSAVTEDPENLQILSDCGIVQALSQCTTIDDEGVRRNLAEAVARAATLQKNAQEFGWNGVVNVMRNFLLTKSILLHTHAMRALAALTEVPFNCVVLHECQGVPLVLNDMASPWAELQDLATVVLRNMRRVALDVENKALRSCDYDLFSRVQQGFTTDNLKITDVAERRNPRFHSTVAHRRSKMTRFAL